jgi:hypothetical protein
VAALEAGDAARAYGLLDETTRGEVTQEQFATLLEENRAELVAQAAQLKQGRVLTHALVRIKNGERVGLVLEDGRWVIEGGVADAAAMRTPQDTIHALRRALARRSLAGLQRVLARQQRAEIEAEIQQFLEDTEDELDLDVEVRGDNAVVRTSGGRAVFMTREAGEWRVVEIGEYQAQSE